MLMCPNMKLVNTVNSMYLQTLNLNELKVISQKLCQGWPTQQWWSSFEY